MNMIKPAFKLKWLMEILMISLERQLLIKYYVIKHLILPKIQNMLSFKMASFNGIWICLTKKAFKWCGYTWVTSSTRNKSALKSETMLSQEWAKDLQKTKKQKQKEVTRNSKNRRVYSYLSYFKDNICGVDKADMQLIIY